MKSCEVRSCNSQNDPNRMYHKFPCDPLKRKEWFKVLGLKKNDKRAALYVCGKHFRFKDYCWGGKRLKPEAVPSVWLNFNSRQKSSKLSSAKVSTVNVVKPENKVDPKKLSTDRKSSLTRHDNVVQTKKPLKSSPSDRSDSRNVTTKMGKTAMNKVYPKSNRTSSVKDKNDSLHNLEKIKRLSKNRCQETVRSQMSLPDSLKKQDAATRKSKILRSNSTNALSSIEEENSFGLSKSKSQQTNIQKGKDTLSVSEKLTDPVTSTPNENTNYSKPKLNISLENTSVISTTFTIPNHEGLENVPENPVSLAPENLTISEVKLKTSFENKTEDPKSLTKVSNPTIYESKPNLRLESRPNSLTNTEMQNQPESDLPKRKVCESSQIKEPSPDPASILSLSQNHGKQSQPALKNDTVNNELEETTANYRAKRQRTKRRRLISTDSESCEKDCTSVPKKVCSTSRTGNSVSKRSSTHCSLTQIEKTIKEMQQKIDQLEKKSVLDEKRIEAFKNALIKQRNHDIKVIMDEKENELLLRMELLYLDYDPQRICRLCLVQVENRESLTSLFLPQENHTLMSMIKNTINIDIKYDEKMPMGICGECMIQIQRIDWMKRKSQRSNNLIQKFTLKRKGVNDNGTAVAPTEISEEDKPPQDFTFEDDSISEVKIEDVFSLGESEIMEIKQEPQSDEEFMITTNEYIGYDNFKREKDEPRKCRDCRGTFTCNWSWNQHFKWCRRVYRCSECSKCFWNSELFARHRRDRYACRSEQSLRSCDACQVVFRWKYQYLFHLAADACS